MGEALDVANAMYAAFDKNDLNAVLDLQADDVVWHVGQGDGGVLTSPDPKLPYNGTFKGKEGLGEFFKVLLESIRFRHYERTATVEQDDTVVVVIHDQATVLANESEYDTWLIHWIKVRDGKIVYLWNHIDTGPPYLAFNAQ